MAALPDMLCDKEFHKISSVRGHNAAVQFTGFHRCPIAWNFILSDYEKHIVSMFCNMCEDVWTCIWTGDGYINGMEYWAIHCHCENPFSLQCFAQGRLVKNWLTKILCGMAYDMQFWFYRPIANYYAVSEIRFMGSIFYEGVHLIYLSFLSFTNYMLVRPYLSFGEHEAFYDPCFVVLKCMSCKSLTDITAKCCAKRVRTLIKRIVFVLEKKGRDVLRWKQEKKKTKALLKLYRFKVPINVANDLNFYF